MVVGTVPGLISTCRLLNASHLRFDPLDLMTGEGKFVAKGVDQLRQNAQFWKRPSVAPLGFLLLKRW
jgi:hypothetical protein